MSRSEFDWMRELQDVAGRFKDYFEQTQQREHPHRPEPPKPEKPGSVPYDLYIDDNKVCIEVELPGMKKDDIRITMAGDAIEVSGDRQPRRDVLVRPLHEARKYGPFNHRIHLPHEAELDIANASASYTDGVLKIVFPQSGKGLGFAIPVE